jgi:hypothetical protein
VSFDAGVWIAAHEAPTYVGRDGTKHVGKLWSHLEYHRWRKVFKAWKDTPGTDEQYADELKTMIGSMGFTDAVVAEMVDLPWLALEEMLKGFFLLQRKGADESPSASLDSSTLESPPLSSSSPLSRRPNLRRDPPLPEALARTLLESGVADL